MTRVRLPSSALMESFTGFDGITLRSLTAGIIRDWMTWMADKGASGRVILLVKRGNISEAELARRLGMSTTNLYNRLKRDNFTDKDLQRIAEVLNCTFKLGFVFNDTGEEI